MPGSMTCTAAPSRFTPAVMPREAAVEFMRRHREKPFDWYHRKLLRQDPKLTIGDGRISVPKGPGVGIRDVAAVIRGAKQVV